MPHLRPIDRRRGLPTGQPRRRPGRHAASPGELSIVSIPSEISAMQNGRIIKLFPGERYGVIETPDGHEAYFSSDCVAGGDFEGLRVGEHVGFRSEEAEQGMRATLVRRLGEERRRS